MICSMTIVVHVLTALMLLTPAHAVISYERTGWDLSQYPHDIPLDAEVIRIAETDIHVVDYIEPFPNLTSYDLSVTPISEFPDFSNISGTVTDLMLTTTSIAVLPVDTMPTMPLVTYFDLSYNKITHVPDLTAVFPKLETLSIYENRIVEVGPSTAITIYLQHNLMSGPPDLSSATQQFYYLNISTNNISSLPEGSWPLMRSFDELDVSNNQLTTFPDLTNLSVVRTLYLHSNQISSVPSLPRMSSLIKLTLHDNQLTTFPNLTNITAELRQLFVQDNEISTFPDELVQPLKALQTLEIGRRSGQPIYLPNFCVIDTVVLPLSVTVYNSLIHCDKSSLFAKWAQDTSRLSLSYPATCCSPAALAGRDFSSLTADEIWPRQSG